MVSVCMATYNGEKYIHKQISTILSNLGYNDELIISDDSSNDNTVSIIESFDDRRIIFYKNQIYHSPIFNFQFAISKAKNDIIILADQDDEWLEGRVKSVLAVFEMQPKISLIVNRCNIIDKNGRIVRNSHFKDANPVNHTFLYNLLHNPYLGCCMAFRKSILDIAMPFPKQIAMHDIWIGLIAQLNYKCLYLDKALVNYRRHGANVTKDVSIYPVWYKIYYRIVVLYFVICRSIASKLKKNPFVYLP